MAYAICKTFTTKAIHSIDGKEHKHINYFCGRHYECGFGIDVWDKRNKAKLFDDIRTAERYARSLGGKVKEV